MTQIFNPTLLFSPQLPPTLIHTHSFSRTPTLIKCSINENKDESLSGIVNSQVEELLNREENRALLEGLEEATKRVENAKRQLADIERQEIENSRIKEHISQLESKDSELAECQREIFEAKSKLDRADLSLSLNANTSTGGISFTGDESEKVNKDEERWESIKAASVSALVGTLAGLPILFTQVTTSSELILPVATTFVSGALFGVTFRYAIRGDLDNFQLKSGVAAAFGVVKGLATLTGGPPLELSSESLLDHALSGALYVSQNLFIFLFAAVGIDFCFKMGLLSTFPVRRSSSRSISR